MVMMLLSLYNIPGCIPRDERSNKGWSKVEEFDGHFSAAICTPIANQGFDGRYSVTNHSVAPVFRASTRNFSPFRERTFGLGEHAA